MNEPEPVWPSRPEEHQTCVEVDLDALRRNFRRFAERFAPQVGIMLSIKKDAYGHGMIEVARALAAEPRLAGFGVATPEEAVALRREMPDAPILCFPPLRAIELAEAINHEIILTVTDANDAREADLFASGLGKKAKAHLKIDTGMGRMGRFPDEALASIPAISALRNLQIEAVYTHLADGWADAPGARIQYDKLLNFARGCGGLGLPNLSSHVGGSDALSLAGAIESGAVRAGIAIYGYHPGIAELEPVMTFKSRVIYRRSAPAGTKISYGGTHVLRRDSQLAIVGAGYGNGYPRILSNRGSVLIREQPCPILGRVCMDQIVVDVTDAPEVQPGDEAMLFGRQGGATLGADRVAELAGTIPYELLCLAGQINPRNYELQITNYKKKMDEQPVA